MELWNGSSVAPPHNLPKTASYNFAAQYCSQSDWEQAFSGEGASEREREREVMVVFGTDDIEKFKADLRDLKESGDELPWDAEDAPPGLSWTCPKGEMCKCNKGGPRAKISCKLFRCVSSCRATCRAACCAACRAACRAPRQSPPPRSCDDDSFVLQVPANRWPAARQARAGRLYSFTPAAAASNAAGRACGTAGCSRNANAR
jgi:hypothetical protein